MVSSEESIFRLFGNLFLPPPEKHLTKKEMSTLLLLLLQLARLEKASPAEYIGDSPCSDDGTRKEFEAFKRREVASWLLTRKTEGEIVAPSGSIAAMVGILLNHPSFVTDYGINGEVCDPSNSCIELVIGKGFNKGNAFWFDHFSRRERKSDSMQGYSVATTACHVDWCAFLQHQMHAKVEIVWGKANYDRLRKTLDLSTFRLWGPLSMVDIYLEWTTKGTVVPCKHMLPSSTIFAKYLLY